MCINESRWITKTAFITGSWLSLIVAIYIMIGISVQGCDKSPCAMECESYEGIETIQEIPTETKTIELSFDITPEERELAERIVAAEARGEGYLGMLAVAQVIRDRAELWDKSVMEILIQDGQFAEPYTGDIPDLVSTAVHEVFDLGYRVTEMPTTHFYAHEKCYPYWAKEKVTVTVIGGHTFMY